MGVREEERTIGGVTYLVRQHGYKAGRALLPVVLRGVGPTLGTLLEGLMSKDGKVSLGSNLDLSAALSEFSNSLSEQDLERITDKMAERTWILGGADLGYAPDANGRVHLLSVEEEHWPERYGDWLKWLAFALEVNFSSFLGETGSVGGVIAAVVGAASPSPSPTTSTGDSGQSSAPG